MAARRRVWVLTVVCLAIACLGGLGLLALRQFDAVVFSESDAELLSHRDFESGNASLEFMFESRASGMVRYSYENNTDRERTFAWRELTATTPTGRNVTCWGDDSSRLYVVPPGRRIEAYGGCDVGNEPGTYIFEYQGVEVGELTR